MQNSTLIKGFTSVVQNFCDSGVTTNTFVEDFAVKRLFKKWQRPDENIVAQLRAKAWFDWSNYDQAVNFSTLDAFCVYQDQPRLWTEVRRELKSLQLSFSAGRLSFSAGSSFEASDGANSMEEKLQNLPWTITKDCIEPFLTVLMQNRCLLECLRWRFAGLFKAGSPVVLYYKAPGKNSQRIVCESLHAFYFDSMFSKCGYEPRNLYRLMLLNVVQIVLGSRFSSVPKNNQVRRPINIEPLCNMIVQKVVGSQIRGFLCHNYGIDLDTLADTHRDRISDPELATIDLRNASDSISIGLCKFLLPPRIFEVLMACRSPYILHDGDWFPINKISAMGNGFTFELMSLLLTVISRHLDQTATVFGDDIIIHNVVADQMVDVLESIGFQVNIEKSFIDSPFRESCGAFYHDSFGYLKSFDFLWPETEHDCVVIYNKVAALSHIGVFSDLEKDLRRLIPKAMRGPEDSSKTALEYLRGKTIGSQENEHLDSYFRVKGLVPSRYSGELSDKLYRTFSLLNFRVKDSFIFLGLTSRAEEVNLQVVELLMDKHIGKYFAYMQAGGRTRNIRSWTTSWAVCKFVYVDGRVFRLRHLLSTLKQSTPIATSLDVA